MYLNEGCGFLADERGCPRPLFNVKVTSSVRTLEDWISLHYYSPTSPSGPGGFRAVGVDAEWDNGMYGDAKAGWNRDVGGTKIDTMQLTGPGGDTIILRFRGGETGERLGGGGVFGRFMGDPMIRKVGAGVNEDLKRVAAAANVEVRGAYDLGFMMMRRREFGGGGNGGIGTNLVGLKRIYEGIRGRGAAWSKDKEALRKGRWGGERPLTSRQVKYAAEDSWVSWWCYEEAARRGLAVMDQKDSDGALVEGLCREMTRVNKHDRDPDGLKGHAAAFRGCLMVAEECSYSTVSMMKALEHWSVMEVWVGRMNPKTRYIYMNPKTRTGTMPARLKGGCEGGQHEDDLDDGQEGGAPYDFERNPFRYAKHWSDEVREYEKMDRKGKLASVGEGLISRFIFVPGGAGSTRRKKKNVLRDHLAWLMFEKCGLDDEEVERHEKLGRDREFVVNMLCPHDSGTGGIRVLEEIPKWEYDDGIWDQYGRLFLMVKMSDGWAVTVSSTEKRILPDKLEDLDGEWERESYMRKSTMKEAVLNPKKNSMMWKNMGYSFGRKKKKELTKEE
ncbi:hypothetical protein TrRE_jg6343, partial [Triparma retinervis]